MTQSSIWLNKVEEQIIEALKIPPLQAPHFPLLEIQTFLEETLCKGEVTLKVGPAQMKMQDHFLASLGNNPLSIALQVSPLEGELFWMMPYEDIVKWVHWQKDEDDKAFELENPDLIKAIYKYTILEILAMLGKTESYKEFTFRLKDHVKFSKTAYAIDISLTYQEETIWGRLLLSETFQRSLSNYFAAKKVTLSSLKNFHQLTLPLSLRNGSITLTQQELKDMREGDFLIIEDAYFHPSKGSGSLKVYLHNTPLFLVKPKDDKLKILDTIFSYEEGHDRR